MTETPADIAPPSQDRGGNLWAFTSPAPLARAVIVLLLLLAALDGAIIVSTLIQIALIHRMMRGEDLGAGEAAANDARQQAVASIGVLPHLATAVVFIWWLWRAYGNLFALSSRHPSTKRGWAIGAWFVPFLNLFRPYEIVRETWWVSANPREAGQTWDYTPVAAPVIKWWWGLYLFANIYGRILNRLPLPETVEGSQRLSVAIIAGALLEATAAILAARVVKMISDQQDASRELLAHDTAVPAQAPLEPV